MLGGLELRALRPLLNWVARKLGQTINLRDAPYNAAADGSTDDQAAIVAAIAAAKSSGKAVYAPSGGYSHSDNITLDGVVMFGDGNATVFAAKDPNKSAIILTGTGAALRSVKTTSPNAIARDASNLANGVFINGASEFKVEDCYITGCEGAGILNSGGTKGRIAHNYVKSTLADAIHNTNVASQIDIIGNIIDSSGDDGIAVVSYQANVNPCIAINIVGNVIKSNSTRGIAVVGGENINIAGNLCELTAAAGIYVAQETAFATLAPKHINVVGNTLKKCAGQGGNTHSAIHVAGGDASFKGYNINIRANQVVENGATSAYGIGITSNMQFVTVEGNSIRDLTNGSGIFTDGEDTVVRNNQLRTIPQSGIVIDTNSLGKVLVTGNRGDNLNTSNVASQRGISVGTTPTSLTQLIANDNHFTDGANALSAAVFLNTLNKSQRSCYGNTWNGVPVADSSMLEKSTNDYQLILNSSTKRFSFGTKYETSNIQIDGSASETFTIIVAGKRNSPLKFSFSAVRHLDANQYAHINELWVFVNGAGTGAAGTDFVALTGSTSYQRCNGSTGAAGAGIVKQNGTWGTIALTVDGSDNVSVTFTPPAATAMNIFCRVEFAYKDG